MKYIHLVLVVLVTGCSFNRDETKVELKLTLIQLANTYLTGLNKGEFKMIQNVIDWDGYQTTCKCSISKVKTQMVAVAKDAPLRDLAVTKVTSYKDDATVYLTGQSGILKDKEILVDFHWNGSGWLIKGDNLFSRENHLLNY